MSGTQIALAQYLLVGVADTWWSARASMRRLGSPYSALDWVFGIALWPVIYLTLLWRAAKRRRAR